MSTFKLGSRSLRRLTGVHPDLVKVVKLAIQYTPIDFTVLEGVRSVARQRELVRTGASQTMESRHITGHAVDLGAFVAGNVQWEWALYPQIADALRLAAIDLDIPVRWGGGWILLNELGSQQAIVRATEAYKAARQAQKKRAFLDGPHFELLRARYPA
jgi:peptidoglycan L-alanyl-D-glutamate endopeptidase CwlK